MIKTRVLQRLQDCGLTLSRNKCAFAQNSIEFLGFELSAKGIQASSRKVDIILNIKKPENITELKSFFICVISRQNPLSFYYKYWVDPYIRSVFEG